MTWKKERILILVKAYPEQSDKYGSSICMAGIIEEYNWIRIYPIQFDYFIKNLNFKKFTWIEADIQKVKEKLMRKESHKVKLNTIKIVDDSLAQLKGSKSQKNKIWAERRSILNKLLNKSINELKQKWKQDRTSLGIIKPNLVDFRLRKPLSQIIIERKKMFQKTLMDEKILVADKIEHAISYKFRCNDATCTFNKETKKSHDITCEDWELFEAIRKWPYSLEEKELKLKEKFFDWMKNRDLYFCMGMFSQYPTWLIIGLLYPPKEEVKSKASSPMII